MNGTLLLIFCVASALLCYAAFALSFKRKTLSDILWYVGIASNAVLVGNNWLVNGYVPFVSMYQVLTFLSLTFAAVYVYIRYMHDGAFMKPYFMISSAVVMTGVCFMDKAAVWSFPPALQSAYFVPHVLAYMISYSLTTVACIICIIGMIKKDNKYETGVYNLVCTAFPFMTAGLFLGALWANACWGEYWSWDTKEIWSLMAWSALILYLHFRRNDKLKKFASYFVPLAFAFVIVTLLFVNVFGGSAHAYG